MERKLYPVWGYTGEYEDYSHWVVGLFPYERSAQAVADHLNKVAAEQGVHNSRASYEQRELAEPILKAAGDPVAHIDYTGIGYRVGEPLRQFVDFADFKMTGAKP
jgi:hypothetical protein